MENYTFLQQYGQLQQDIMFDKFIDLQYAVVNYCEGDTTAFWNHAITNTNLDTNQLKEIENILTKLNRIPAIYFENTNQLNSLVTFLEKNEYKFLFEDSWMFHTGNNININPKHKVHKIKDEKNLKTFLKILDQCYQKDDPQNAYGELGDYLDIVKETWHKQHSSNKVEYFMVYKNNTPVAVSTLTNYKKLGYISNVGSLHSVRGKGYGKTATLHCVTKSIQNENNQHFLATEEKTYANEFYKRIGFTTRFTATGYIKQ